MRPTLALFFILTSTFIYSQNRSDVKIYDHNYSLIDFSDSVSLENYESIYIDTDRLNFAPISYIPSEILLLPKLKSISFVILNDSVSGKIFSVLKQVITLEELNIRGNNFNLTSVFEQEEYNSLGHFPIEINSLTNLKVLKLSGHLLTSVDISLNSLLKLERIELFRNKFTEFPVQLLLLPNIKYLGLENNYIKILPKDLCSSSLTNLTIGRNHIKKLPLCILTNGNLTQVMLNENFISEELANEYLETIRENGYPLLLNIQSQVSLEDYPK